MKLYKINKTKWREYKQFLLAAVKNEPFAFSQDINDYKKDIQDKILEQKIAGEFNNKKYLYFIAEDNKTIIGSIACSFSKNRKTSHVVELFKFYVLPDFRNLGIGKQLLNLIFSYLEKNYPEIEKLKLYVYATQKVALAIYLKKGFSICGKLSKEMKIEQQYYDLYLMEKFLK